MEKIIESLVARASKNIDLTDLISIENICLKNKNEFHMSLFLSLKLTRSKKLFSGFDNNETYFVDVIFTIYKENNRIKTKDEHILVYTDADLSTHLGQIELIMNPILTNNKLVSIGYRRELDSIVLKTRVRNDRGKSFLKLVMILLRKNLHLILNYY